MVKAAQQNNTEVCICIWIVNRSDVVSIIVVPSEALCVHRGQGWAGDGADPGGSTRSICQCVPNCLVKLQAEVSGLNPAFLSKILFPLTGKAPAAPEQLSDHLRRL